MDCQSIHPLSLQAFVAVSHLPRAPNDGPMMVSLRNNLRVGISHRSCTGGGIASAIGRGPGGSAKS